MKRSRMRRSTFAIPKGKGRNKAKNQYPLPDIAHARNAVARVNQFGTPQEKKMVYSAVRRKFPAFAKRSKVVPTATGIGRHYGEPKGTTHRKGK